MFTVFILISSITYSLCPLKVHFPLTHYAAWGVGFVSMMESSMHKRYPEVVLQMESLKQEAVQPG